MVLDSAALAVSILVPSLVSFASYRRLDLVPLALVTTGLALLCGGTAHVVLFGWPALSDWMVCGWVASNVCHLGVGWLASLPHRSLLSARRLTSDLAHSSWIASFTFALSALITPGLSRRIGLLLAVTLATVGVMVLLGSGRAQRLLGGGSARSERLHQIIGEWAEKGCHQAPSRTGMWATLMIAPALGTIFAGLLEQENLSFWLLVVASTFLCVFLFFDVVVGLAAALGPVAAAITSLGVLRLFDPSGMRSFVVASIALGLGLMLSWVLVRGHPLHREEVRERMRSHHAPAVMFCVSAVLGLFLLGVLADPRFRGIAAACSAGLFVLLIANLMVLPAIVQRLLGPAGEPSTPPPPGSPQHQRRTLRRFAHLPPYARFWARGKLRFDPMFPRLAEVVPERGHVLDVGCGLGLVAAWLHIARPLLRFTCIDVLPNRIRIARHTLRDAGSARVADVTEVVGSGATWADGPFDACLCLDVIHHLEDVQPVLEGLGRRLAQGGVLILRSATLSEGSKAETWELSLERIVVRARGQRVHLYRTVDEIKSLLSKAGFSAVNVEPAPGNRAETLFIARAR